MSTVKTIRAVVGHSEEVLATDAIADVIAQCEAELDGDEPKAGLLFASVDYEHDELLDAIAQRWPGLPLIGGSTDGELTSKLGFLHDSVALTLLTGNFEAAVGTGYDLSQGVGTAVEAATAVLGGRAPAACFTLFAPSANSSEVLRELDTRIGNAACPVLGGLTADHREFARTREFSGKEVIQDSLACLFVFGDLQISWGTASGWFPMGEAHRVTRADGHVVHEIDGQPALDVYRMYWGELPVDSLGEYPLAVFPEGLEGPSFLRAALGSDPDAGWIRFAGEVPEGSQVKVTEVLPEGILSGSTQSMSDAVTRYPGTAPAVALVFSCAARKWVLGTRAEQEIELLRGAASVSDDSDIPLAGFYCFGEIAPNGPGEPTLFHNETCVTVLLGE